MVTVIFLKKENGLKGNYCYPSDEPIHDKKLFHYLLPFSCRKYARSYLALVKSGEVLSKRHRFEDGGAGTDQRPMMPEVDADFIREHLTDLSRPILRAQEVGDISATKAR